VLKLGVNSCILLYIVVLLYIVKVGPNFVGETEWHLLPAHLLFATTCSGEISPKPALLSFDN